MFCKKCLKEGLKERGNIFFLLFAAVGMAGVVALSIQSYVMGPLKGASKVTRNNSAQTQMQLGIRVAATNAVTQQASGGDCDGDGMVEPLPYVDAGVAAHPTGGGYLPNNVGSVKMDPWGTQYGYCVWDHGSAIDDAGCGGAPQLRLPGTDGQEWETMAVISAGPDRVFQTSCNAWADVNADNLPDTPLVDKPSSSDDVYFSWSYQDATTGSGGLWTLEAADPTTAEINKNLSVKDGSNVEQLSFDATTKALSVGSGGSGEFPTVKTDYIQALTNPSIQLLDAIQFSPEDGSGTTFTVQNATGDHLRVSTGTYNMLSFEPGSNQIVWKNSSAAGESLSYYLYYARPFLRITSAANNNYTTGFVIANTNSAGIVDKTHFVEGQHTATSLETVATSQVLFGLEATGAGAANMAGYMAFTTRPTGTAYAATLPERMRITSAGDVGIGTNNPQGRLHVYNASLSAILGDGGNVGIGTTTPATKLDVAGEIKIGTSVASCAAALEGSLRYNSSLTCLELCDGVNWGCIQSGSCGTMTPATFSFTDVTGAAASTVTKSNIIQITGIGTCQIPVVLTGTNTPEYRICTDGTSDANCNASEVQTWTTSRKSISNNQYLQLRMTSSASGAVTRTADVNVGGASASWSVQTTGACTDPSPPVGTVCPDGSIYVGLSPDGNVKMYVMACRFGMTFDGRETCSGSFSNFQWANAASVTGVTNANTGETNTSTLAASVAAGSPHSAAQICQNHIQGGQTDWYLPATNEASVIVAACASLPNGAQCSNGNRAWTSTEQSSGNARYYQTNSGISQSGKTGAVSVYCVRKD